MSQLVTTLLGQIVIFVGLGVSVYTLKRSLKKDMDAKLVADTLLTKTVTDLKDKFDKETGGNSGGMREAINNIGAKQTAIKEVMDNEARKSDTIANIVHRLEGAFEEHRLTHER